MSAFVSLEEYRNTVYEPDCEYVDGVLFERHGGEYLHARTLSNLVYCIRAKYPALHTYMGWRWRISETRYRVPDITVLLFKSETDYLMEAAWLVIEVMSESDNATCFFEKLREYADKGTPNIWVFDPRLGGMWIYRWPALTEIQGDTIATTDATVQLTRDEIFAE